MRLFFKPLILALLMAFPALAQIPAPQINLAGNIGCQGFPCLNNGILTMTDASRAMTAQETSAVGGFVVTGTWTADRTMTMPAGRFQFVSVGNGTSGGHNFILCSASGGACLTIPSGQAATGVWFNGTNVTGNLTTGGGSGTVSGQANGVVPLSTGSTTIGAQSHIADSGSAVTISEPVTFAGSGNQITLPETTAPTGLSAGNQTLQAIASTHTTHLYSGTTDEGALCSATNGVCSTGGGSGNVSPAFPGSTMNLAGDLANSSIGQNTFQFTDGSGPYYSAGPIYSPNGIYIDDFSLALSANPSAFQAADVLNIIHKFIAAKNSNGEFPVSISPAGASTGYYSGFDSHQAYAAVDGWLGVVWDLSIWCSMPGVTTSACNTEYAADVAPIKTALAYFPKDGTYHMPQVTLGNEWVASTLFMEVMRNSGQVANGAVWYEYALQLMGSLATQAGDSTNATFFNTEKSLVDSGIQANLIDGTGMLKTATGQNSTNLDVQTSVLWAYLGYGTSSQRTAIANYINTNYSTLVDSEGFILNSPTTWTNSGCIPAGGGAPYVPVGTGSCYNGAGLASPNYQWGRWSHDFNWFATVLSTVNPTQALTMEQNFIHGQDPRAEWHAVGSVSPGGTSPNMESPAGAYTFAQTHSRPSPPPLTNFATGETFYAHPDWTTHGLSFFHNPSGTGTPEANLVLNYTNNTTGGPFVDLTLIRGAGANEVVDVQNTNPAGISGFSLEDYSGASAAGVGYANASFALPWLRDSLYFYNSAGTGNVCVANLNLGLCQTVFNYDGSTTSGYPFTATAIAGTTGTFSGALSGTSGAFSLGATVGGSLGVGGAAVLPGGVGHSISVSDANYPQVIINNTAAPSDEKVFRIYSNGGVTNLQFLNDAGTAASSIATIGRTGYTPLFFNLIGIPLSFNQNAGISSTVAGVLAIGNGTQGDISGTIKAATAVLVGKAGAGGIVSMTEGTSSGGVTGVDQIYAGSVNHSLHMNNNGGESTIVGTTAGGTAGNCAQFSGSGTVYSISDSGAPCSAGSFTHLNQTASGNFAGTCVMSGTTCTSSLTSAYTSPICIATQQGGTPVAISCAVSGTTVLITAASTSSSTFGFIVVGNPN